MHESNGLFRKFLIFGSFAVFMFVCWLIFQPMLHGESQIFHAGGENYNASYQSVEVEIPPMEHIEQESPVETRVGRSEAPVRIVEADTNDEVAEISDYEAEKIARGR